MAYNFQDNEVPGLAYYEESDYCRFDHTRIGSKAPLHRVIIDRGNEIAVGIELGYGDEPVHPAVQGTASGLVALPKPTVQEGLANLR